MNKLYYQPKGYWFGDCMPFGKGDTFYLFHQRDTRKPGPFGEPFGWDLTTTKDFVQYVDRGHAIVRGSDEEQDQFIFAGSVFEDKNHLFHAFYTGFNRDYPEQGKPAQVLMHATSKDLEHWEKTYDALTFSPQEGYDPNDWRDPFVLWDNENNQYLLILGARKIQGDKLINGCTVQFVSKDLVNWEFKGTFWAPNIYSMHEMPDLFHIGEWWYLIISEYSDKNKTVYRRSKTLKGPWTAPTDDAFDGRDYYAGRTFSIGNQRIIFGWVPTRENNDDRNNFEWGGTFVPHEIHQRKDGSLGVAPVKSLFFAFSESENLPKQKISTIDSYVEVPFCQDCGDLYKFEADVEFSEGTRSFSLQLLENSMTGEAYHFKFFIGENRFVFDKIPNQPWFQCMNIGLERPLSLHAGEKYHLCLIVDDTIATLYVNDIALNTRMYKHLGDCVSLGVTDGTLEISNAQIARGLKR